MPAPIVIAAVKIAADIAIDYAWKKIKGIFNWKARDEVNRWEHRKAEAKDMAARFQSRLNLIITGINEGTYPLNEAIRDHTWHTEEYTRFEYYITRDMYPWAPHDKFDYPSAKGGAIALLEIYRTWMPLFEEVLYKGFPTYDWQFITFTKSPTSATDPKVLQSNVTRLAVPAGLLVLGLVLSS